LLKSSTLDVEVSPASLEDASRERDDLRPVGLWTTEAIHELLRRLDVEGQVQAKEIRAAAGLVGTIDRQVVYEVCGYDDDRMLRGFTRPTARITADLQRAGIVADSVAPALLPLYTDDARASGFRIPAEMVQALYDESVGHDEPDAGASDRNREGGKYEPLTNWLNDQVGDEFPMTFSQIEDIMGDQLAPSARKYLPYWHSIQNSLGNAIANAGFRASRVNPTAETVVLIRR
jgi:hypothetical protein